MGYYNFAHCSNSDSNFIDDMLGICYSTYKFNYNREEIKKIAQILIYKKNYVQKV